MNKLVHFFIFISLLLVGTESFAQRSIKVRDKILIKSAPKGSKNTVIKKVSLKNPLLGKSARALAAGDCQFIEPLMETFTDLWDDELGYIVGTNVFEDKQKAEFYDFSSAIVNNYLNGVIIYFSDAYAEDEDYSKVVTIRVFNGTTNTPGAQLASVELTLEEIAAYLEDPEYDGVPIDFTNLAIPASKKLFISVDVSELDIFSGDLLGIYSSDWDELTPNTAWEQWSDNVWYPFSSAAGWEGNVSIAMVPLVGETADCEQLVPVKFVSVNGEKFGSENKISWKIEAQANTKSFEIEKSADGISYSKIGTVSYISNVASYSFIDKNADGLSYYRIKEVSTNGQIVYSTVVTLKRELNSQAGIVQVYPTVVTNDVNVIVNAKSNDVTRLNLYDITGKLIFSKSVRTNGTNQLVNFNTTGLSKGTYLIKILNSKVEKSVERFIKN